jgi:hypothetical protein
MATRSQYPAPLEIRQVANGFVVTEVGRRDRQGFDPILDESQVFQTFAELVSYLADHLSWRAGNITSDLDEHLPPYGY